MLSADTARIRRMADTILELYPRPGTQRRLKNLYLGQLAELPEEITPFIYSNFIASLDGRIALPASQRHTHQVPPAIANARDWRLFQELAAQADLLITSARYFRQAADTEAQAELPLGSSGEFDDLRAWRVGQGLAAQPDIAVFSASLDIPLETLDHYSDRRLFLVTGENADPAGLERLTADGRMQLIRCGTGRRVEATTLRQQLRRYGYRRVYAIAGPAVLHTLASGHALDRLYHTTAHCLLGGTEFDTFVWGEQLQPAFSLPLRAMYLDTAVPPGCGGQTLAVYGR
jgi:riboflavin biosynthesis pyrimidine reductase